MATSTGLDICTDADVISRFGDGARLIQLLDKSATGTLDTVRLQQIRWGAGETISARANVQSQVQAWAQAIAQNPALSWPYFFLDIVAWYSVALCWDEGGQGQAKPPHVKDKETRILDTECELLRRGQISLGAPPQYPALQQSIKLVDNDPTNSRMTLASMTKWLC